MGQDTGKNELDKIFTCLKDNGYTFEDLEEARTEGYIVANFTKDIVYSDKHGDLVNDRYIKIKIEFDSDFDYKNSYRDSDNVYTFDSDKAEQFVDILLNKSMNYQSTGRGTRNHPRKKIIKHKKNTRKNRKHKFNFRTS